MSVDVDLVERPSRELEDHVLIAEQIERAHIELVFAVVFDGVDPAGLGLVLVADDHEHQRGIGCGRPPEEEVGVVAEHADGVVFVVDRLAHVEERRTVVTVSLKSPHCTPSDRSAGPVNSPWSVTSA